MSTTSSILSASCALLQHVPFSSLLLDWICRGGIWHFSLAWHTAAGCASIPSLLLMHFCSSFSSGDLPGPDVAQGFATARNTQLARQLQGGGDTGQLKVGWGSFFAKFTMGSWFLSLQHPVQFLGNPGEGVVDGCKQQIPRDSQKKTSRICQPFVKWRP